LSFKLTS